MRRHRPSFCGVRFFMNTLMPYLCQPRNIFVAYLNICLRRVREVVEKGWNARRSWHFRERFIAYSCQPPDNLLTESLVLNFKLPVKSLDKKRAKQTSGHSVMCSHFLDFFVFVSRCLKWRHLHCLASSENIYVICVRAHNMFVCVEIQMKNSRINLLYYTYICGTTSSLASLYS